MRTYRRVIILRASVRGSHAEYLCLPAEDLVPVPKGVDPVEAACLAFIHLTAYQMMHRPARVKEGDRALIHSAGGHRLGLPSSNSAACAG
jgi:NADPH2:quinone reductase